MNTPNHQPGRAFDMGLLRFKDLLDSWSRAAGIQAGKLQSDADGTSQWRRAPVWKAIGLAKASGTDADWELAMGLLAQAALDNKRPVMVASTALSSILRQGHDIPFRALAMLVGPIESERSMGSAGYDFEHSFPLERSEQAWTLALEAARLAEPARPAPLG